jgi:hypothetical protein
VSDLAELIAKVKNFGNVYEDEELCQVGIALEAALERLRGGVGQGQRELAQEILKPHWPVVHNMEENAAREREVDRIVAVMLRSTSPAQAAKTPAREDQ